MTNILPIDDQEKKERKAAKKRVDFANYKRRQQDEAKEGRLDDPLGMEVF